MWRKRLTGLLLGCFALSAAAQPHEHGKGTLFIAQDDNLWQIQFTLPAADIFGFAHKPQASEQVKHAKSQAAILANIQNLLIVPAGCEVISEELAMPFKIDEPTTAEHQKENHNHHYDVEATFLLDCQTRLARIEIVIFALFSNIERLEVLWALESGQGSQIISAITQKLTF